jgi:predicted nucleic acid-binding protein
MNTLALALDTCLLRVLDEPNEIHYDEPAMLAAEVTAELIGALRGQKAFLLLDSDHEILDQYQRHLRQRQLAQTILGCANKYSRMHFESRKLPAKKLQKLTRIQFDQDDLCFLHVATPHQGYYVTTEEKHLAVRRRQRILEICGVRIISLPELLDVCRAAGRS